MVVRRRLHITGRVQGVSYRAACAAEARRLGCGGFVRNCADGSVLAEVEGDEQAVAALIAWCESGPPLAAVDAVTVAPCAPCGEADFRIRRDL